jgi:hypothetical protein
MIMELKRMLRPILSPLLQPIRKRWPNLKTDKNLFRGFKEPLMSKVATTRFFSYSDHQSIVGWMTPRERQLLYALGLWLPGPVVEIGSWLGLSTTAIARGIRDSGEQKRFDTFDLKLTTDMYHPVEDGMAFCLPDDPVPLWVNSKRDYEATILPFINKPGGSNQILRDNLARLGLSKFVTDHVGDFKRMPAHACRWLFCDIVHNFREIDVNAPFIRRFLSSNSILVCHDMGTDPELIGALRDRIPLGHGVAIDSMFVAEIRE